MLGLTLMLMMVMVVAPPLLSPGWWLAGATDLCLVGWRIDRERQKVAAVVGRIDGRSIVD